MYYDHFGLKEAPFKITPNTDFFYSGANRGAVLEALMYAILTGEGIIKVVGEVGSGKTMLCRMLQDKLPETVENIYLANPSVAPEDILHVLAFELQLKLPKNADRIKVMQLLQDHLIKRHTEGKKVVIFVEEAQGMPIETLEEIRLLTNLETKQDKLLQIVLFGQPELDVNLNENKIRQLRERITHSFYLSPFDKSDIGPYIESRLRKAGYTGPPLFTPDALKLLSRASEGLVRRANILADKALLSTFSENSYQVTRKNVLAAIKDSEFSREMGKGHLFRRWLLRLAVLLILVGLAGSLYHAWQNKQLNFNLPNIGQLLSHAQIANDKKDNKATTPAKVEALPRDVVKTQQTDHLSAGGYDPTIDANSKPNTNPAAQAATTPPAQAVPPSTTALPTTSPDTIATPSKPLSPDSTNATTTSETANETKQTEQPPQPVLSESLKAKLEESKAWFLAQNAGTFTIQLLGLPVSQVEAQLSVVAKNLDIEQVHLYQKAVKGQPYITMVYGTYTDKNEAASAIESLPDFIKSNAPYIRTIGGILKETKHLQ